MKRLTQIFQALLGVVALILTALVAAGRLAWRTIRNWWKKRSKWLRRSIVAILLFASCCTNTAKGNGMEISSMVDGVGGDYTANAAAIKEKKLEMLSIADSVGHFWFSDDTEFQLQDPHAYWLMNRMMQMV